MEASLTVLRKTLNKQLGDIVVVTLDEFYKTKIDTVSSLSTEVKQSIKDMMDAYKSELKDGIKTDNKKTKKSATKGTRKASRYNRYMAQKMAELKESHPELSNNDKFAKIAAQWKVDKDSWEDTDGSETV